MIVVAMEGAVTSVGGKAVRKMAMTKWVQVSQPGVVMLNKTFFFCAVSWWKGGELQWAVTVIEKRKRWRGDVRHRGEEGDEVLWAGWAEKEGKEKRQWCSGPKERMNYHGTRKTTGYLALIPN